MPSLTLPVHSYNQPSRAPARLVNCYAQQTVGKGPVELLGAPGVALFAQPGVGPGRGLYVMRGSLYAVSGTVLYRISEAGVSSVLGAMPGSGKIMFAGDGTDIVFSNRWRYSAGSTALIADSDFPAINAVDFVDGYIVYAESGTGRWGCSGLYNSGSYDALDYATAEGYHDDLVTLKVDHRQVVLFGQQTVEIWWNSGQEGFPFERLSGGVLDIGAVAVHGVAKQDNSLFWLASDRTIRRLSGQTPMRVSQHGVEEKLRAYARVDDCEAFPLTWNGHLWVVFKFPSAGACWVFDCTTNEWHERASYGSSTWNMVDSVECFGKVLVQDSVTGAIGYLSDEVYTEFGEIMRREWTYPTVYETNTARVHSQLELVARPGTAPVGVTPYVGLDISDDGGNTWSALPPRELGRVGEYKHIVRWNRLGQARDRVYRAYVDSAAVPVCVTDTTLVIE